MESGTRFPETERRWEEAALERRDLRKDQESLGVFVCGMLREVGARDGHSTPSQSSTGFSSKPGSSLPVL